jgi:ABC-type transport system substrate-binding protein
MRPLPLLFALLVVGLGIVLGVGVMLRQAPVAVVPTVQPSNTGRLGLGAVEYRGGVPQGHVYCGIAEEPESVNPFTAHGNTARRYVLGFTHEGLLDLDPKTGELRPALASAYQPADDAMSCTFTLRDGVQFSDGSPMTMADVLFGWELAKAGHLQLGFVGDAFGRVASVEVQDERHLRVWFKEAYYAALHAVGQSWLVGKRQFFVDRVAVMAQRLGHPAPAVDTAEFAELLRNLNRVSGPGTGPFVLPGDGEEPTTWRRRQDLLLPYNVLHWRRALTPGTWNLAAIRLLFRDRSSAPLELFSRNVDWYYDSNYAALLAKRPDLKDDYRTLVYDYPTQGILSMIWNCAHRPLDDVRVRRALARLFSREAIVAAFHQEASPAVAFTKPSSADYPTSLRPPEFDVSAARRELREAGFDPAAGKPLRLSVLCGIGIPQLHETLAYFQDAAREAGIELVCHELDNTAFVAQKKAETWDGMLTIRSLRAWGDPFDFVHTSGTDNDGHWSNAEADRLAEAVRRELDERRRNELLRELHGVVNEQQPVALLAYPLVAILFNKHIQNAVPGPRGLWPEQFWVPPEFQRR